MDFVRITKFRYKNSLPLCLSLSLSPTHDPSHALSSGAAHVPVTRATLSLSLSLSLPPPLFLCFFLAFFVCLFVSFLFSLSSQGRQRWGVQKITKFSLLEILSRSRKLNLQIYIWLGTYKWYKIQMVKNYFPVPLPKNLWCNFVFVKYSSKGPRST